MFLKKTLAVCLIGLGLGILLVLFAPSKWMVVYNRIQPIVCVGLMWLAC